jgi:calmodulin-binding transcription activator
MYLALSIIKKCAWKLISFVSQGRYYSSQLSNGPPESLSSLSHPNAIHGNQYHSSASGTSEGSESYQSYSNLSSLTEVTSYYVNKEHNRDSGTLLSIPEIGQTYLEQNSAVYQADNGSTSNKSGLNVALKKIAEQLSLGDDDDDYIYSNQAQPLGSAKNVEAAGKQCNHASNWKLFHIYVCISFFTTGT